MDQSQSQIECTAKSWPNSAQLRQKLSIPLALSFCPTSQQFSSHTASFNEKTLEKYRCQSCKAFINKFCLIRGQSKFQREINVDQYDCSLCGFSNQVDEKINTNAPENTQLSYKFKASKVQRTIVSKQRVFVFVLDFSNYGDTTQKYLLYAINAIRQFVNHALKEKNNIKIMILGFDDGIQLFYIKNQIQRLVYWEDENKNTVNQYPFSNQQIALLSECKDNVYTILEVLQEQINLKKFKSNSSSKKIMEIIQYALKHTKTESGKIFVITGLNHELEHFKVMHNYDSTVQDAHKHHYPVVKKQCLNQNVHNLLQSTQMSISLFFHKSSYCNLMPFHILTKSTNGQLRHYFPQQASHFFYEFNYLLHQCLYEVKYETLLRVRTGIGLKLVGIFGNYRQWKGIPQQIQMMSCESNRKYVFEFIIEGKVNGPRTVAQFATLYTDLKGNRWYKIVTHPIQLVQEIRQILPQINYQMVNFTYLKAILHNMDLTPYFRKLQLALQQRCKRHVKVIRQLQLQNINIQAVNNKDIISQPYLEKTRPYIIFTYMLMNHFLLNLHQRRDVYLDLNVQARSKIATYEECMKIIWPILYTIDQNKMEIVQMKVQNLQKGKIGMLVDRGDQIYIFIRDRNVRNVIKMAKDYKQAISSTPGLQQLYSLIEDLENQKFYPHLDILILEQNFMQSFDIFSRKGPQSFQSFVEDLISN